MKTAVATPDEVRYPLYVLQLEETVRELDRLLSDEGPTILADHPEDHGLEPWVAELITRLRKR